MKRAIDLVMFFVCCLLLISLSACHDSDNSRNDTVPPPTGSASFFSVSPYYTPGIEPDVAFADDGTVVQVHDSGSGRLWYKVGEVYGPVIIWGKGHDYDDGKEPSVSFADNGIVVEVHRSESTYALWYHVGEIQKTDNSDVGEIVWGESHKYDDDECNSPAVAVYGATVVSVHSHSDRLYYRVGTVNAEDKTIDWSDSYKYDNGILPDIAIQGDTVVEVHQSENYNTLWYRVGEINGLDIAWYGSRKYDTGTHPGVGLLGNGTVVETHTSDNHDTLWSHVGAIQGADIIWQDSHMLAKNLGTKYLPTSVAVRDCGADEPVVAIMTILDEPVWKLSDGDWNVSERRSYLRDELGIIRESRIQLTQERWMELSPWIDDLPIRKLRLIGSHDAASDGIAGDSDRCIGYCRVDDRKDCSGHPSDSQLENYRCQSESMLDQLRAGVRYFDLRVALQGGKFYSEHIFLAGPFWLDEPFEGEGGILNQIHQFFEECTGEVIILTTSSDHMYSDTTDNGLATKDERNAYFDMVMKKLPGMLAPAPEFSDDLTKSEKSSASLDKTLRDIHDSGGTIIYFGLSDDEVEPEYQKYIWPIQKDGIWHEKASDLKILYNGYDGNDDGDYDDYDNDDDKDDIDEMGLNKEVRNWYDEGAASDKLHVMQAMTNGGPMGKIDMATVVNSQILEWLLSDVWKDTDIPVIQVNDAVNTPDWVRVFLLNWMPKKQ